MLDTKLSEGAGSLGTRHLNVLELLRPEDELEDLLVSGEYGAASALAKKHQLSQDTVLK